MSLVEAKSLVDSSADSEDIAVVHPCSADNWFAERLRRDSWFGIPMPPATGHDNGRIAWEGYHDVERSIELFLPAPLRRAHQLSSGRAPEGYSTSHRRRLHCSVSVEGEFHKLAGPCSGDSTSVL